MEVNGVFWLIKRLQGFLLSFGAMSDGREGGCACGVVRYRLTSEPLFVHCCHCLNCQRQTGSAFVINLLIEADRVEVRGEPQPVDAVELGGGAVQPPPVPQERDQREEQDPAGPEVAVRARDEPDDRADEERDERRARLLDELATQCRPPGRELCSAGDGGRGQA